MIQISSGYSSLLNSPFLSLTCPNGGETSTEQQVQLLGNLWTKFIHVLRQTERSPGTKIQQNSSDNKEYIDRHEVDRLATG